MHLATDVARRLLRRLPGSGFLIPVLVSVLAMGLA